ncbi:MAG: protein-glutamate O-methyltransferase CheR [Proteobacteria bacterium]|nr:protein-glutamate O-methyltransferase CheR [Pseudomonadota bacterium]MBU1639433.1 protein-glutamate O-methyltransferase CheR [Pseudomonadota bacterium]
MVISPTPLTDKLFKQFSSLVYDQTGIFLKPEKRELLNARLGKRLRHCTIASFQEYYDYVLNDGSGEELIHLIDAVSTNFTSFFREKTHFDYLSSTVLREFADQGLSGEFKVWSAACSSGEEPYTLAIVLNEFGAKKQQFRFSIQATDISTKVLAMAEKGVYAAEKVQGMSKELVRAYFQKGTGGSEGYVKVKKALRQPISFRRFNLMDQYPWNAEFDVIFCRNVMIYFNRETQQQLVDKFYTCLKPGGHLFIGHSESLTSITHRFRQVTTTGYKK